MLPTQKISDNLGCLQRVFFMAAQECFFLPRLRAMASREFRNNRNARNEWFDHAAMGIFNRGMATVAATYLGLDIVSAAIAGQVGGACLNAVARQWMKEYAPSGTLRLT